MAHRIFVAHPSTLLTDHRPHGDGLVAHGFLREMGLRGHVVHVAAETADLRAPLPGAVQVHELGTASLPVAAARLVLMRRLRRLWQRLGGAEAFDLVHQLNPVDVGLTLALADVPTPVVLGPYVPDWPAASGDGVEPHRRLSLAARGRVRAAQQRRATAVLLSTPAARSKLAVRHGRHPHVHEVGMGIDPRTWSPDPALPEDARDEVLVLANLDARKGVLVALDAFVRLADRVPQARLVIAGSGPQEDELRRRIAAGGPLAGRVRLAGRVDRDTARAAVRGCALLCVPSFGEPFGMTILEAMACGRPVVATDAGGPRHLVSREGGRLVPPGDAVALAGALHELLVDPPVRAALGAHNRRTVLERHAWSRVADRLEAAYVAALADPRPPLRRARARPAAG